MSNITELDKQNFEDYTKSGLVLVDFWAPWCGPCRALSPVIDALAEKYKNKLNFAKLNIDETPSFAIKYGVDTIPNVCLFSDGQLVDRSIGYVPQAIIEEMIKNHI